MNKFTEMLEAIWANDLIRAAVYLIIALVSAWLASFIVKKLTRLIGVEKWEKKDSGVSTARLIGRLTFLVVFLLFLPAVLSALGLEGVSGPISDFASAFTEYLPRIIAAGLLVFIGIFLGGILSEVLSGILAKCGVDDLINKLRSKRKNRASGSTDGEETGTDSGETRGIRISEIIGKIVKALVILVAIVEAMAVLNIEAISAPAISVIESIFGVIPEIILAGIVIAVGAVIATLAAELIESLCYGIDLDGSVARLMPKMKSGISLTRVFSCAVRWIIVLFIIAEGARILGLTVVLDLASGLIAYAPMVIKAVLIAVAALLGAGLADKALTKTGAKAAAMIARTIIYVVAAFMILSQLGFASVIVNYAFIISLSALAVAFAVAFGIGGRDFAKRTLELVRLPDGKTGGESVSNSGEDTSNAKATDRSYGKK